MIKKLNFAALVMAAGLMTVSCSNDNDEVKAPQSETSFKVSIKAAPSTRAAAGTETGVGDENTINTGWFVIAKEAGADYKAFQATGSTSGLGTDDVAELRGVAANTEFYVIANAPAGFIAAGNTYPDAAAVMDLTTRLSKASINAMTTALQANPGVPSFGTERMILSGKAMSPGDQPAGAPATIVEVALERNMSKVTLTIQKELSATSTAPGFADAEFRSVEGITLNRVKSDVVPFNDNVVALTPIPAEDEEVAGDFTGNDGNIPAPGSADAFKAYRFEYTGLQTAWEKDVTNGESYFYVTPNLVDRNDHTPFVVVEAKVFADFDGDGTAHEMSRYFKIFIADPDEAGEGNKTIRNGSYKINAKFATLGYSTEQEAIDGKTDMDVQVTLAHWSIREYSVEI